MKCRLFTPILISFLMAIAVFPAAVASQVKEEQGKKPAAADLEKFPLGNWVEVEATEKLYQFDLEAGSAVDVKLGHHISPLTVIIYGPSALDRIQQPVSNLSAREQDVYMVRRLRSVDPVEFVSIVANTSGKYVVRISPLAISKWAVFLAAPRQATPRDHDSTEAARLATVVADLGRQNSPRDILNASGRRVELYRKIADPPSLGIVLRNHASIQVFASSTRDAIATILEARSIFIRLNEMDHAVNASPCALYESVGLIQDWIFCAEENVRLSASGSKVRHIQTIRDLGFVYHTLGEEGKASELYQSAIAAWRSMADDKNSYVSEEIQARTDLAKLKAGLIRLGKRLDFIPKRTDADLRLAVLQFNEALKLIEEHKVGGKANILHMLGMVCSDLGQYDNSERYFDEALKAYAQMPGSVALVQADRSSSYAARGEYKKAKDLLNAVLPDLEKFNIHPLRLASLFLDVRDTESAAAYYNKVIQKGLSESNWSDVSLAYYGLARIERENGNFLNAQHYISAAIETADSLRNSIVDDSIRGVYFGAVKKYFDFYIDLLMQAHKAQPEKQYDHLALELSEKARSRSLIGLLRMSGVDIREGVDEKLLERERTLKIQLAERATRKSRFLMAKRNSADVEKAQRDVDEATEAVARIEAEIREKSPSYAAVTQPSGITTAGIQELLDPATTLLEYSLGDKKSYLWVVSKDRVSSFELPGRDEIDRQTRAVYEAVTARDKSHVAKLRGGAAEGDPSRSAFAALGQTLLSSAAPHIKNKRVLVVPDGSLNYVPFAALPLQSGINGNFAFHPLVGEHEIVALPSALTLKILREQKRSGSPAQKTLAVFADPVFGTNDERAAGAPRRSGRRRQAKDTVALRDLDLAAASTGLSGGLPRLSFSRREADAIAAPLPSHLATKQIGFAATKESVFDLGLDQYRIVHFATHGFLDSKHPSLSGMVLSLLDEKGNEVDGFLRLQDIYNLKLNAELVVLSACGTALGKEVRGEGIIGLTRGFMYAGSPRVVASLWKVDDAATADFMTIFYRKMLTDNMRPAAALRAAQNEMMKQFRWRSPFYWASFVLQGEWK